MQADVVERVIRIRFRAPVIRCGVRGEPAQPVISQRLIVFTVDQIRDRLEVGVGVINIRFAKTEVASLVIGNVGWKLASILLNRRRDAVVQAVAGGAPIRVVAYVAGVEGAAALNHGSSPRGIREHAEYAAVRVDNRTQMAIGVIAVTDRADEVVIVGKPLRFAREQASHVVHTALDDDAADRNRQPSCRVVMVDRALRASRWDLVGDPVHRVVRAGGPGACRYLTLPTDGTVTIDDLASRQPKDVVGIVVAIYRAVAFRIVEPT